MNTNNIKSFAKQARLILMEGVKQRLLYWGFDANGNNTETVETTTGGYIFRGQVFNDDSVPAKWNKLKNKLTNKQAVQDVIEEAAYTWFNRLMAIHILEKRGYIQPTLTYAAEIKTPQIVQNAKRGQHQLQQQKYIDLLNEYLKEDKEDQALGLLLTRLCNNNIVLHDVFGRIDDYTEILLPSNLLQREGIIDLLNSEVITEAEYKEVELIGWLYQFYISDKKDEVFKGFKANKKARPEDIPAATQIFTPKWIVKYMVENTVGKTYLEFDKNSDLKSEMKYLVENDTVTSNELPIQEESRSLITSLEELTLIDPASGSGHILVTGFELLFKMYREQGYTAKNAVTSILQNNLFGLDIDDRAMQLARFAVLLKATEFYPEVINPLDSKTLLLPHIYSFPEAHHFQIEEIQGFLGKQGSAFAAELKKALVLLNEGKNIGAALKLELSPEAHTFISNQYYNWNTQYQAGTLDILQQDLWNNLKPFLEVLLVMTKKYTAVVANPPYMGQSNMNAELKNYVNKYYPLTKSDLMTVFMELSGLLIKEKGMIAMINLPSWMFLSSFEEYREKLLNDFNINSLLHLGRGVFGSDFGSVAFVLKYSKVDSLGIYRRLFKEHVIVETVDEKEKKFFKNNYGYYIFDQKKLKKIPGSPIAYWASNTIIDLFGKNQTLNSVGLVRQGASTSDNNRFLKFWHEVRVSKIGFNLKNLEEANLTNFKWFPYNKGGSYRKWYGNHEYIINYENDGFELKEFQSTLNQGWTARLKSREYYFKPSVSWPKITAGAFSARYYPNGFIFDVAGCCYYPQINIEENKIVGFLNSRVAKCFLEFLSPTLNFEIEQVKKLPYLDLSTLKSNTTDLIFKLSKTDWNSRETSWDFEQSPLLNESTSLKEAYQKWQDNATQDFFQLHENEEELNRIFIDIYGLQDELTPEVALKDITILQEELDRNALEQLEPVFRAKGLDAVQLPIKKDEVISQFLSYCIGVFMGRYRLDKPGLHIAHPNPTEEELAPYVTARRNDEAISLTINNSPLTITIDDDAIIPLMGSECAFPDDALVRIKNLIHTVWSEKSQIENSNFMNECLGLDLDKWLTEKFWGYHTSMYKKKPIYWLFCSNPKKPQAAAFKVITYMHRMDKHTVGKIQRSYLHPHQEWIKKEIESLVANEANLSRPEMKRLEKLRLWEIECRDYNEVLKEIANQEITFDLDDGVSVNFEKFEGAVAKI